MVSVKMLEDLGITEPTAGMKIQLTVVTGWQEKKEELFYLSGWYTSYTDSGSKAQQGYISEKRRQSGESYRRKFGDTDLSIRPDEP